MVVAIETTKFFPLAPRYALPTWATAPTREEWLQRLVDALRPVFAALQVTCPCGNAKKGHDPNCPYCKGSGVMRTQIPVRVRVSCSWPRSKNAIGECWHPRLSADGYYEIMVSYAHDRPIDAAGTLLHELVHTVVGLGAKHGKFFKAVALAVGLEGRMTSTGPGKSMRDRLHGLIDRHCGAYPGAPLGNKYRYTGAIDGPDGGADDGGPDSSGPGVQTNRQLLITCDTCSAKLRGSRSTIQALMPTPDSHFACPCGGAWRPQKPDVVWPPETP